MATGNLIGVSLTHFSTSAQFPLGSIQVIDGVPAIYALGASTDTAASTAVKVDVSDGYKVGSGTGYTTGSAGFPANQYGWIAMTTNPLTAVTA